MPFYKNATLSLDHAFTAIPESMPFGLKYYTAELHCTAYVQSTQPPVVGTALVLRRARSGMM